MDAAAAQQLVTAIQALAVAAAALPPPPTPPAPAAPAADPLTSPYEGRPRLWAQVKPLLRWSSCSCL